MMTPSLFASSAKADVVMVRAAAIIARPRVLVFISTPALLKLFSGK
jgi:hypothetical protein